MQQATPASQEKAEEKSITIRQDNRRMAIEVMGLSDGAMHLLGYAPELIDGMKLGAMLPGRIAMQLDEYVEYEENGQDVAAVLSRVKDFAVQGRDGREHHFRLRVVRQPPVAGHACFRLVLQSSNPVPRRQEPFRAVLKEHFAGHQVLNAVTGLVDQPSFIKDIEFTKHYVLKDKLVASVAVLRLTQPRVVPPAMLKHVAGVIMSNLRGDDVVAGVEHDELALLMLDTQGEAARMVLNRLRWLVGTNPYAAPGEEIQAIQCRIAFARLHGDGEDRLVLDKLHMALDAAGGSQIILNCDE